MAAAIGSKVEMLWNRYPVARPSLNLGSKPRRGSVSFRTSVAGGIVVLPTAVVSKPAL